MLQRHGYDVTSTDIADRGFGTPGVDFLLCQTVPEGCQALVTNPPYGTDTPPYKGQEKSAMAMLRFVDHALRLTGSVQGQLALLVRPIRTIARPPVWCAVDLRDGNQALVADNEENELVRGVSGVRNTDVQRNAMRAAPK